VTAVFALRASPSGITRKLTFFIGRGSPQEAAQKLDHRNHAPPVTGGASYHSMLPCPCVGRGSPQEAAQKPDHRNHAPPVTGGTSYNSMLPYPCVGRSRAKTGSPEPRAPGYGRRVLQFNATLSLVGRSRAKTGSPEPRAPGYGRRVLHR
jgi:hypothetical protein